MLLPNMMICEFLWHFAGIRIIIYAYTILSQTDSLRLFGSGESTYAAFRLVETCSLPPAGLDGSTGLIYFPIKRAVLS